jgi:copper(I)-binding protein
LAFRALRTPTGTSGFPSQLRQGEYDAVSRNSRRPAAIAIAGVFAVAPLVSACAAGTHPQSAKPTQLAEGVNAVMNGVYVRNVFLLGPAPGQQLPAGSSAPLYAWFVNKALTPDRLVAVETSGVAQSAEISGGAISLPPGELVRTVQTPSAQAAPSATPTSSKSHAAKSAAGRTPRTPKPGTSAPGASATPGAPTLSAVPASAQPSKIVLKGLSQALVPGATVRLILHFQRAGAVTLNVPVTPRSGYYATYSPAAVPPTTTPSATPLPTQSQSAQSAGRSAKKTKTKKPTATPSS